jgi:hypothetical protein
VSQALNTNRLNNGEQRSTLAQKGDLREEHREKSNQLKKKELVLQN